MNNLKKIFIRDSTIFMKDQTINSKNSYSPINISFNIRGLIRNIIIHPNSYVIAVLYEKIIGTHTYNIYYYDVMTGKLITTTPDWQGGTEHFLCCSEDGSEIIGVTDDQYMKIPIEDKIKNYLPAIIKEKTLLFFSCLIRNNMGLPIPKEIPQSIARMFLEISKV